MPDWTRSMKQTFEYYIVDPGTWRDKTKISNVESCSITRDSEVNTLGSATITCEEDFSDNYIRCYLVTEQDGRIEKETLGTHIYQSPSIEYQSTRHSSSQDGYTPLIELDEKLPPYGYTIFSGEPIVGMTGRLIQEHARAPVIFGTGEGTLVDDFVANTEDTWLTFLTDFIANDKYHFGLNPDGRILLEKDQNTDALKPIWTFDDSNSSILFPDVTLARDLYGIPNVVEVVYSPPDGTAMFVRAENNDPASPTSIQNRGREIVFRDTNPSVVDTINEAQLHEYARNVLKEKSSLEYTLTYKHGYCPVRLGDCVLLDYKRAGLRRIKAKIIRQVINCTTGCTVQETAVFSKQLWG